MIPRLFCLALEVGAPAPAWRVVDASGTAQTVAEASAGRTIVVHRGPGAKARTGAKLPIWAAPAGSGEAEAVVVSEGVVRRVEKGDPAALAAKWVRGSDLYALECARCHGAEGEDESYPGVRKLKGIGRRKSEAQIEDKVRTSSIFDGARFSGEEIAALVAYLNGL